MIDLGFNYRLTDIQCALGLSQLPKLEQFLAKREAIAERYVVALKDLPGLAIPRVAPDVRHAWHIFPVLVEPARLRVGRDEVFSALRAENIGVTMHYVPAYWHPYYARPRLPARAVPDRRGRGLAHLLAADLPGDERRRRRGRGRRAVEGAGALHAMTSAPVVTVLAEAGRGVGLGHLRRCQALTAALTASGASVELVVAGQGWEPAAAVGLDWLGDTAALRAALRARRPDAVVVDSYRADAALLRDLGTQAPCVVAVDDLADRALPVSIVVNGGWPAPRLTYRTLPETVRLFGSQYALLDPVYGEPARRPPSSGVRRVLVTLGGDADTEALGPAIDAVKRAVPTAAVDVAVGAWTAGDLAVDGVTVHRGLASLRPLIVAADLVVSGGGMTLYECLAAGAPVVALTMADNQRPNVTEMARAGLIVAAEPSLEAAVARVAGDRGLRRKLATLGREAVDGRGAGRVAVAIMRACRTAGLAKGAR